MPIISTTKPASLPPSGTASGDLSGTYPSPTVAKVNGIAVTGTPSSGQVPTATGATAATWQTPGGASPVAFEGPTAIAFNSAGITTFPGVTICSVPVGTVVVGVYLIPTADWDGGAGMTQISATAVISVAASSGRTIAAWDLLQAESVHSDALVMGKLTLSQSDTLLRFGGVPLQAPATICVNVFTDGAGLTAGTADVYALLATPT